MAYYVNTRRRELVVRVCLGALPGTIRGIVLVRAARCALLAIALSAPLWPLLAHLSSIDYLGRVSWSAPRAILLALACVVVAIVISLVPARAATSISPAEELKEQ
jgi:ABC-type antimicrobial peptide transport system permease subunit